jgi:hypothetical protein
MIKFPDAAVQDLYDQWKNSSEAGCEIIGHDYVVMCRKERVTFPHINCPVATVITAQVNIAPGNVVVRDLFKNLVSLPRTLDVRYFDTIRQMRDTIVLEDIKYDMQSARKFQFQNCGVM